MEGGAFGPCPSSLPFSGSEMMERMPMACPSPCTSLSPLSCDPSHLPLEALPGRLHHRLTRHADRAVMTSGLTYLGQWFLEFTHCCPLAPMGP